MSLVLAVVAGSLSMVEGIGAGGLPGFRGFVQEGRYTTSRERGWSRQGCPSSGWEHLSRAKRVGACKITEYEAGVGASRELLRGLGLAAGSSCLSAGQRGFVIVCLKRLAGGWVCSQACDRSQPYGPVAGAIKGWGF
jgi:hypothetical protein